MFVRLVVVAAFFVVASPGRAAEPSVTLSADVLTRVDHEGRACGVEDDGSTNVICGRAFLTDLVAPAHLVMDRDACSRLLEQLFDQQSCGLDQADCGQFRSWSTPPPSTRVLGGSCAAVRVTQFGPGAGASQRLLPRAASETIPLFRRARPPTPPPRA